MLSAEKFTQHAVKPDQIIQNVAYDLCQLFAAHQGFPQGFKLRVPGTPFSGIKGSLNKI